MIEAKHLASPPPFDFRNIHERDLVGVFHADYEDPWKGRISKIENDSITIDPYEPLPGNIRRLYKRDIKKIYRLDINSGGLKELIYLSPDHLLKDYT